MASLFHCAVLCVCECVWGSSVVLRQVTKQQQRQSCAAPGTTQRVVQQNNKKSDFLDSQKCAKLRSVVILWRHWWKAGEIDLSERTKYFPNYYFSSKMWPKITLLGCYLDRKYNNNNWSKAKTNKNICRKDVYIVVERKEALYHGMYSTFAHIWSSRCSSTLTCYTILHND